MNPADIDPSLRAEPLLESLDDGFSPPAQEDAPAEAQDPDSPIQRVLGPQSAF